MDNCLENSYWSLVIGHWSLVIGHWSLVIGHWSLVIGYLQRTKDKGQITNKPGAWLLLIRV
ncbi:hypothetical protein [Nostoc sp.]|uniref:hypothetical protein n=1 Tax=Nostoc sp. TaxID=1180 RepID=UPI002FF7539B